MKQYKVYLGNIDAKKINVFKNENKYGVKTNCIFIDMFKLEDVPKIQKEMYYYLVDKECLDKINNLQSKIDKAIILIDKYLEMVDNPDINMQCVKDILKEDE